MNNRVILITGSNRGIGNAVGLELCKLGQTVIFTARNINTLDVTKTHCIKKGYKADFYELDVSKAESIQSLQINLKKKI